MNDVWQFDDFFEGREIAGIELSLGAPQVLLWERIFGPTISTVDPPAGLLVATMMKAYLLAFDPRPQGNIHAAQKLNFSGHRFNLRGSLDATVTCKKKEIRKARRWVTFEVALRSGKVTVLTGEILTIWAE